MAERYFTIPGNGSDEWDPEIHGQEIKPHDDAYSGDFAEIGWEPGRYSFNFGASGNTYYLHAPEAPTQSSPNQNILRGFHEFLKVAYDE